MPTEVADRLPDAPETPRPAPLDPVRSRYREAVARRSLVRAGVIGGGLLMVGVTLGLGQAYLNRGKGPPSPEVPVERPVGKPLEALSLRWLPRDVNAILHVRPYRLADAKTLSALPPRLLTAVEALTGQKPGDLEELTLGVRVNEDVLPRVTLVAIARRPLPAPRKSGGRTETRGRYEFRSTEVSGLPVPVWSARPTPTTLVAVLDPDHAADLPQEIPDPSTPLALASAELNDLLATRMDQSSRAWLAADTDAWDQSLALRLAVGDVPRLAEARGASLVRNEDDPPGLIGWLHFRDAAAGESARAALDARARELGGERLIVGGAGEWVVLRLPADGVTLSELAAKVVPPRPPKR